MRQFLYYKEFWTPQGCLVKVKDTVTIEEELKHREIILQTEQEDYEYEDSNNERPPS